ncbi:NAD(P)/FAD-dependent oxidoreductase [Spirillospora sp. NBC_01491]|uniref:NAD(P)/FAD-dependent oxidoreductase n=1 Tax=Spirillospora sp. NBC_01491 TaxID=2976007 RepID=UPI002E30A22D|nr:NAD(P)/FAD-dependent oxidoreductase [Spirillospora sp. NBC_01491]
MTVLIAGGGIAGPITALALRKAGIDAVVFEARSETADAAGAFLTLATNGIDALRTIGAGEAALAAGFSTPTLTLRSATGKNLGATRTGRELPDGTASHTLRRADLYRILHDEAVSRGVRIEHGKRLVGAEETGDGVRAVFADGTEATGELLIGADGVHSTVRSLIDPAAPAPAYSGLIGLGGYAAGTGLDGADGGYTMIFGRRAFFGYAASPDDGVWWFANVPRAREPERGELEAVSGEQWRRTLTDLFAGDAGPAVRCVEASDPGDLRATPVHSVPHLPVWHNGRMVVIGDAAHAPTPTSGQGASLSIEDAVVLAKCLRDLPAPRAAFARFEELRRPRVESIIKAAARINSNKAAGPVGRVLRDTFLPVVLKLTANSKQVMSAYDHHIDWDERVTAN